MKFLHLISLVMASVLTAQGQTIADAFPDFAALSQEPEYYEYSHSTAFPNPDRTQQRPSVEQWSHSLKKRSSVTDGKPQTVVFRSGTTIRFVWERFGGRHAPGCFYKITPESIELVRPESNEDRLWGNQLGISRWVWTYRASGEKESKEFYRWSPKLTFDREGLHFSWQLERRDGQSK